MVCYHVPPSGQDGGTEENAPHFFWFNLCVLLELQDPADGKLFVFFSCLAKLRKS